MKDFIFICIMCGAFVAFVGGLVYAHISWAREQIEKAYRRGYEKGEQMTREEAIEIIKREFAMDEDVEKLYPEVVEARDMAISALEQEPCEDLEREYEKTKALFSKIVNDEDAISREEAISAIVNADNAQDEIDSIRALPSVTPKPTECEDAISREAAIDWYCKTICQCGCLDREKCKVLKGIYNLPPVQPSRKGHWIDYRDDGFVECPFCGHATNCEDDIEELHYCFYCGAELSADMRGDTE